MSSFTIRMGNKHFKADYEVEHASMGSPSDSSGTYLTIQEVSRRYLPDQQIAPHQYSPPSDIYTAQVLQQQQTCQEPSQISSPSSGPTHSQILQATPHEIDASNNSQRISRPLNTSTSWLQDSSGTSLPGQVAQIDVRYAAEYQRMEQTSAVYHENPSGQGYVGVLHSDLQGLQQYTAINSIPLNKCKVIYSPSETATLHSGHNEPLLLESNSAPLVSSAKSPSSDCCQTNEPKAQNLQILESSSGASNAKHLGTAHLTTPSEHSIVYEHRRKLKGEFPLSKPKANVDRKTYDSCLVRLAEEKAKSESFTSLASSIKKEDANIRNLSRPGKCNFNSKRIKHLRTKVKRQHQLFAMVVLFRSVEVKQTAVCPRIRVYNKYSMVCREFDIKPMCNASLGKLVRLCFPNVTTRRLGIRGTSRYHYCGLKLMDDSNNDCLDSIEFVRTKSGDIHPSKENEYNSNSESNNSNTNNRNHKISELSFDLHVISCVIGRAPPFELSVDEFVQEFAGDKPAEENLLFREFVQVYVNFCLCVFKHFKFIKMKSLFEEILRFDLEAEVSPKCFAFINDPVNHKLVASFIEKCDADLCSHSILLLSKVILQDVPLAVRKQIFKLDSNLVAFIEKMKLPYYIRLRKTVSIKKFIDLLSSLGRVTNNASKLSRSMSDRSVRIDMFQEWKSINIERTIVQDPLLSDKLKEKMTSFFCDEVTIAFKELQTLTLPSEHSTAIRSCIIRNLGTILIRSPGNFEDTDPKEFLLCTVASIASLTRALSSKAGNNIQNSVIHVAQWWAINCWAIEFLNFLGELGGYLKQNDQLYKKIDTLSSLH